MTAIGFIFTVSVCGSFLACSYWFIKLKHLRETQVHKKESITVLIVDDELYILDMLREQLAFFGYNVITACSGKEALQKADEFKRIDILLTDIMMPYMNGIELAKQFNADEDKAEIAGWLHDISAVFPSAERAKVARELGIEVLPEEDTFPMIIHQKLSIVLGRELFGVTDSETLSAIGCHTTLKQDASLLDKVVFVADKIAWDQPGQPPYLNEILAGLDKSVDHAAFVYLDYIWQMRASLKVLHPWTAQSHAQLKQQLAEK